MPLIKPPRTAALLVSGLRTERTASPPDDRALREAVGPGGGALVPLLLLLGALAGCGTSGTQVDSATVTAPPPAASPPAPEVEAEPRSPSSLELDDPLPRDPAVRKGKLDNGLTYYIRRNSRPEKRAELRLVVDAGSILEEEDQRGLAHFVEHMAFNGTTHFEKQELVEYLETIGMRFGADVNAYTSFDETVYMLKVPTDDAEILGTAFQILEDWAHEVSFEGEEIEKERGVVIEEWRLGLGAGARIRDQHFPVLFEGSLYAERLPIGTKEVLEGFEHDTLRRFYRDWYRPGLMAVVAVGDFDSDRIEELIRSHFSGSWGPEEPPPRRTAEVPDHDETLISVATDPELPRASVSVNTKYDLLPEELVRDYRRSLVEDLFHGVLNGRLAERAREADPPFLGAFSSQGAFVRAKGVYSLGAGVDESGIQRGLEALLTEAERIRRFGFGEAEVERQKADILRFMESAYEERDKTESALYAAEYTRNFLEDEPFPGIAAELAIVRKVLPTIEVSELDALSERWITDRSRVILAAAPEKEGLEPPTEGELRAAFREVEESEIDPYEDRVADRELMERRPEPATITEEREIEELDVHVWTLENGIRVVLKPTDFKNDEVAFVAFSPGGHSLVPTEDYVAGATAATVVGQGGLDGLDVVALEKLLSGKVVRVSPYISELSEGFSGGGSPQDLETLFQLVYLAFTEPRRDAEAFTSYVTRMGGILRNRQVQPEVVFNEALLEALYQGHPRRRPFDESFLDEMDLDKSMAIYRDRFADASDFTFVFVGSFTLEAIRPLVRSYLGDLPDLGRDETFRDVGADTPEKVVEETVVKGKEPRARFRIVFSGPFEQSVESRYLQQSLEQLLRMRLREQLREEMGGVYGVSLSGANDHFPEPAYEFSIGFACDPERLEALRAAVFAEIERAKTGLASAEEIAKLKELQRRERETALRTNDFWLGSLRYAFYYGVDPLLIESYDERVEALEPEALQAMARRQFDLDRYVQVVLLPEDDEEEVASE